MPVSNGEFVPPPPTDQQRRVMALADQETERWRRRVGMTRRDFVRTAMATAIGFWAIDAVSPRRWGFFGPAERANAASSQTDACNLEWAGATGLETRNNLPGEFIFDVQSHHVDPAGMWRVTNPAFEAAFAALWPQAHPGAEGGGEVDPIANLSRFHYLKELYLDSATTATVLSAVPSAPDTKQPLPISEAAETVQVVNRLARSSRVVMHAFVMPNRGAYGALKKPKFLDEELDLMSARAAKYRGFLRGWKTYCPWGDVPNVSGWSLDSEVGFRFLWQVLELSRRHPEIPPVVATHKGFALPGFDQRAASPRDVGPAARVFPDVRFVVYHSGHDIGEGAQGPYPGDAAVPASSRRVDALIRTLRVNGLDGPSNGGNSPNVWAELGSVWRDYMGSPDSAAHLLGKLIKYVGPKRVVWGTDSLWYGSPQPEIVALRRFNFTQQAKELYGLPYGLDGDVDHPTRKATRPEHTIRNAIFGRNAAAVYGIDPDATRNAISCDSVNAAREEYITSPGTPREAAPLAANQVQGPRTAAALARERKGKPWSP
jgi:predicted TIM-barrel fold metal-dependent hydrolase